MTAHTRTHNARGERIDEPTQCEACLQTWPCEVEKILWSLAAYRQAAEQLAQRIAEIADALGIPEDEQETSLTCLSAIERVAR